MLSVFVSTRGGDQISNVIDTVVIEVTMAEEYSQDCKQANEKKWCINNEHIELWAMVRYFIALDLAQLCLP